MKRSSSVVALGFLFLGLTAFPQSAVADDPIDLEAPSDEIPELVAIFSNGFESGNSSAWSDTTPNTCPTPTGGPTFHANSVAPNEIWTANGSPHILTNFVLVPAGITLTVAPCAELRIRASVSLEVDGTLVARGTPLQRITIHRDDPALPFNYLEVYSPGFADLAFADIVGGGSSFAALLISGGAPPLALPVSVDHVKVIGSAGYGVRLYSNAGFASSSRDLVVSGSGATQPASPFPIRLDQTAVGTLPTGSYTGNASDLVLVSVTAHVAADLSFHDRGVPYQIGDGASGSSGILEVNGNPALATLTIDPGVEIRFYSSAPSFGALFVETLGRLVAVGTATAPILFTGAGVAPPAGSWAGIAFLATVDPGTLLDHVRIEAAGAPSSWVGFGCPPPAMGTQTDSALTIFIQPAIEFLLHSTISNSISHGVFRAWTGDLVDFLPTNTFQNVALCHQVLPHPPPPDLCPVNPDCPQ